MPTKIKNQPTSEQIRAKLKAENRPVLVAFSCGKDSIAAELALQEAGIETHLAYMYTIPKGEDGVSLKFIDDQIKYFEDKFDKKIHRYPHPSLYRFLNNFVFQPPERLAIIENAMLPSPTYTQLWDLVRQDLELAPDTWVADGVRAADSIVRRASFSKHGIMKPSNRKVSVIADWLKSEVMDIIDRHGVKLPIDYKIFGRSFDGLDYRFLKPIKDHLPDDYERILHWYPLADLEIFRNEYC